MYIIFAFKGAITSSNPDSRSIVSVTLSDDIAFTNDINNTGNLHYAYGRVSENDGAVIMAALNNPQSVSVTLGDVNNRHKISHITLAQNADRGPYARKLVNPQIKVRPAAYRAGATSFFKNL